MTSAETPSTVAGIGIDDTGAASPLIHAIDDAVDAQHGLEQRLRLEFGTNNTDFRALMLIYRMRRRGRDTRPRDLTRHLGLTSGATSRVVGRLHSAGLLERSSDPDDARSGLLTLTESACDRLRTSTEAVRVDLDRIMASIATTEEARMIELLDQVRAVFTAHHRAAPETVGAAVRPAMRRP